MPKALEISITTDTTTPIGVLSRGQGWSLQLRGASAGTVTFVETSPSGVDALVTDDLGATISITTFPTNINLWVGSGAEIKIVTASLGGTLVVLAKPLNTS